MTRVGLRVVAGHEAVLHLRCRWSAEVADGVEDAGFATRFAAWWDEQADRRTVWVAFDDGEQPVGMVSLVEVSRMPRPGRSTARWGQLAALYVVPDHRGGGIGRRLIDSALAAARQRGYRRVVVSPAPGSDAMLRHAGFRAAEELLVLPLT